MVILKTMVFLSGLFGPLSLTTSYLEMPSMDTCKAFIQTEVRNETSGDGKPEVIWNSDATDVTVKLSSWPYNVSVYRKCSETK